MNPVTQRLQWSSTTMAMFAIALALGLGTAGCGGGDPRPERTPNIVLVTVDTLRADHMEAYGYARRTTPFISGIAEDGVRFEHAISQAPWTLPSVASIMTSLYPSQHGAIGAETRLPEEAGTLAEALRGVGYRTVGVVSHDFVGSMHGLAQGFDVFDETNVVGHEETTSKALTLSALAALADVSEPFFLWVHYFDPHFTYVRHPEVGFADGYEGELPPEITSGRLTGELAALRQQGRRMEQTDLAYIEAVYDEEIAHTDLWVGTLWRGLGTRGLADRSVLILTSDHGEYFLERGRFFHGKDVYEPLIHVPLIIGGAIDDDLRGVTIEHSVEVRSIPATVMGLLGVEPHGFSGADLLSVERDGGVQTVYSEGSHAFGEDERKYAAVHEGWKLIRNLDDDRFELYELATDRNERRDRWQVESEIEDGIAPILVQRLLGFAGLPRLQAGQLDISPEQRRRLESLGYVR